MRNRYFEFNGKPFPFQNDLGFPEGLIDFILTYGDEALEALRRAAADPEQAQSLQELLDQGILEKVKGRFRLTPRAVNMMQRRALMEIFAHLPRGSRDSHAAKEPGGIGERIEGTRPYEFGDPLSELDSHTTLRNALRRTEAENRATDAGSSGLRPAGRQISPSTPRLRLSQSDLEIHQTEARSSCSTVLLLDMSGSMQRYNRFFNAKKCAMALIALIRQRFPLDTIDLVGFYSGAEQLDIDRLPLLMPKSVTLFDPQVRMRVPLKKIAEAPQHFTNLHLGLLKAERILSRRAGDTKMVFIITDGQPTAHVAGDYVHLIWPPHHSSHNTTLQAALRVSQTGVRVCTFALADDYWDMDWLGFVEQLGRITRGVTFQCASGDLANCVMESYLSGRRKRAFLG